MRGCEFVDDLYRSDESEGLEGKRRLGKEGGEEVGLDYCLY